MGGPVLGDCKSSSDETPLGFAVLPKRWIVAKTFAWVGNRRLARDFERYATTVAAFVRLAMIRIMLRRLTANTLL
jgi:transposase